MADVLDRAPQSDLDPYADAFLTDPFGPYEELRRIGPAVHLTRYGCWALARYVDVHAALTDWRSYASAAGAGLAHFGKEKPWRPPSLLLETDPPIHDKMRAIVDKVVAPAALRHLRELFVPAAASLADRVAAKGRIDGVKDIAEPYVLRVFADAVGLGEDGRENLLPYGDMVFNGFGPFNERFHNSMKSAPTVVPYIAASCQRDALATNGLGAAIYSAAAASGVAENEAGMLVRSFFSAGLDTTVAAIGSALMCLAQNPGEWQKLRADRSLVRNVFEETMRLESPLQSLFRTTTRDVGVGDTRIPADDKVLLILGSANRDPAYWQEPTRFDITRRLQGHVAMGVGIHQCVGQVIARLEAEVLFTALAGRIASIEPAGEPERHLNNAVRSLAHLPLAVKAA
jgi:4-methoxybenzoate monooxygenase (O-demethylating)